jgi:predicted alpha/beta hydrolase family esterase
VDWQAKSKDEPLDFLYSFFKKAFGQAYRLSQNDWAKLQHGKFYNPVQQVKKIDGSKLLIIHAKDDRVVSYGPVAKFARQVNAKLITLPSGGHLHSALLTGPRFYSRIQKFLK